MIVNKILLDVQEIVLEELPNVLKHRYEIVYKEDNSPVTLSDKYLENKISQYLHSVLPDLQFVGEETFKEGELKDIGYIAVLDPIDGTENFCSGMKEWGVSLGIWKDGDHQGSLLMMPELGEYMMTGDKIEKLSSRITGFSSSFNEGIVEGIRDSVEYRVTGCAVYNLMNVIRGTFKRFINPKGAYIWDLLPGLMLALENQCEVFLDDEPFEGQLLDPNRKYRVDIRN